jgi:integrase
MASTTVLHDDDGNVRGYKVRYWSPEGKPKSKTFLGVGAKAAAGAFRTKTEASKLEGLYVDPAAGRITVRDYAEQWRSEVIHRPGTALSVEHIFRLHVYPTLGSRRMASVRRSDLQAWVKRQAETAGPKTLETRWNWMRTMWSAAVEQRVVPISPCGGVKLPAAAPELADGPVDVAMTVEQVAAIAAVLPPRWRRLALVGAQTGLRPGELRGLTVGQVDFLRRRLRVDRQGEGEPLKTKASYRTISLAPVTVEVLSAQLAEYPPGAGGAVFHAARSEGRPISDAALSDGWIRARGRAGIPERFTPHDLRHHHASVLLAGGMSVVVVSKRLGHKTPTETLNTYAHLMDDDDTRTIGVIEAASRASYARPGEHLASL